jgi:N-acetylglucosamine-6-sulfatase
VGSYAPVVCKDHLRFRVKRLIPLLVLLASASLLPVRVVPASASSQPNVVIIMTDDQRWDTMQFMPRTQKILGGYPSITYTNGFVPNALCCPSRTSTLTGDYSHTTGVYGNGGAMGGFMSFTSLSEGGNSTSEANDQHTLATDFHDAGYRTGLVGKYLNGYPEGHYTYIPPGWDSWFSITTGAYYNYYAAADGHQSPLFGESAADYSTTVLGTKADTFITRDSAQPFFLYLAFTAPHGPATPDPRDVGRSSVAGYNHPPSFGNVYPGDPAYIRSLPWSDSLRNAIDAFHAKQLDSLYGVDRQIGRVWQELPDNTIVLFMSDNGFLWGEHRWYGKQVPYNASLRIPMAIVGKGLATPLPTTGVDKRLMLNVDVLPTLEDYAGVPSEALVPLEGLDAFDASVATRSDFVLEHWDDGAYGVRGIPAPPTYCGVRSVRWMYAKYSTGDEQLYNEKVDPYEMDNLVGDPGSQTRLGTMKAKAAGYCTEGAYHPPDWPQFP